MEHAVDLRLAGPPEEARAAADALARAIAGHVRTGAILSLGVAEEQAPRLALQVRMRSREAPETGLPALPLPAAPEEAAAEAIRFLTRWGFLGSAPVP